MSLVRIEATNPTFERIHNAIEIEIARGLKRLEKAEKSGNADALEALVDDECDQVEELLGIAFVSAQVFISRIKTRLKTLNRVCEEDFQQPLDLVSSGDFHRDVVRRGETLQNDPDRYVVEVIYAVGNFWKHSDEWTTCEVPRDNRITRGWELAGRQKPTVAVVSAIGLAPGSSGNLRSAAESIGIEKYDDLRPMRRALTEWAKNVYQEASEGLQKLTNPTPQK